MTRNPKASAGDKYLEQYPRLSRWINVCVGCGAKGYKPDLPEDIYPHPSFATYNLRELFNPLAVNELGLCEVCAKVTEVDSS